LWVIFALLDPDPDSEYGPGSTDPIEYGSGSRIRIHNPGFTGTKKLICKKDNWDIENGFFCLALKKKCLPRCRRRIIRLGVLTVWRIRDVYPGSRIRIFSIPDPNCLHPGSLSKNLSILTPKKANGF
jgi:hypothetical protein